MAAPVEDQVVELWHNLFRMHGYVRDECQPNADLLLQASYARVLTLVTDPMLLRVLKVERPPRLKDPT